MIQEAVADLGQLSYVVCLLGLLIVVGVPRLVGQSPPEDLPSQQLLRAVETHDTVAASRLLDNMANIEVHDQNGATPLMLAAENDDPAMVKLLLEKGANAAARDKSGDTALIDAARGANTEILEALIERTSDDKDREAALFTAAESGAVAMVVIKDPVHPQDNLANARSAAPVEPRWIKAVKLLLDDGVNIEARDPDGSTPLITAAAHGETDIVELLLDRGAEIEATDKRGNTALIAAACECAQATMNSTYDIAKMLLDRGAKVNARTRDGTTALMNAAGGFGSADIAKLLIERGANVRAKNKNGDSALALAMKADKTETIELLKQVLAPR